MKRVLVVGSANMDYTVYTDRFPVPGETIFGSSRFIQPGGKGENQAIAIAKSHKVKCDFIGAIANDTDGSLIKNVLKDNEVNAHLKVIDNTVTGNATILVNKESENQIIIISGANGLLTPNDIDIELIKKCDYVVLQNEISEECNAYVMKRAKEFNKIVVYNPAPYRKLDEELFKYIDFLVPNRIEFERFSKTSDLEEGARKLLSKGIKNVLVTLGTDGSVLINKDEMIHASAFKVKAIDTVAAGDTYVGYFVSSLASGYSIKESMTIASKASSITVTRKGSVVSIPNGEEVYE